MSETVTSLDLSTTFLRLRSDVRVEPLPVGEDFWQKIAAGQLGTFRNEYLVTTHAFDANWPFREMHPMGDEVVAVLSGKIEFVLETAAGDRHLRLDGPGRFLIVPRGTWHTAKVAEPCRLLFITAGEGTQHRPIDPAAE